MQLKVYSIRDTKTEVFTQPFFNHTHGEAERNFRDVINDEKTTLNKHPEDYDLYYLGDYDDTTGKISGQDAPQHIIKAIQLVRKVQ